MNEFRVPTVEVEAEVLCADRRTLSGVFFMPALSAVQEGRMRPEEWVNGALPFFPFRVADPPGSLLLNKSQVLAIIVASSAGSDAGPDENADLARWNGEVPVRRIVVEAGDRRFDGTVVIDMPVNQQRVVDYVNRPDPFLVLRAEDRVCLIRKDRIARVIEIGEA